MNDEPKKCPACGVPRDYHLGLIETCQKLSLLRRRVDEFWRTFDLTPSQREHISQMLEESK